MTAQFHRALATSQFPGLCFALGLLMVTLYTHVVADSARLGAEELTLRPLPAVASTPSSEAAPAGMLRQSQPLRGSSSDATRVPAPRRQPGHSPHNAWQTTPPEQTQFASTFAPRADALSPPRPELPTRQAMHTPSEDSMVASAHLATAFHPEAAGYMASDGGSDGGIASGSRMASQGNAASADQSASTLHSAAAGSSATAGMEGITFELPFISTSLMSDGSELGPESLEYWHEIGKDTKLSSSWNNGLQHQSADRAFRVHVGGRVHSDFLFWSAGDAIQYAAGGVGPLSDGASFRRARIRVNGTLYRNVTWLMEYGFETGVPALFDVFGEMTELPYVGTVRVGHFREPFSMDALTSGNFLTLMERSLIHDAFVPFRNTGIQAHRTLADESVTLAIGGFRANSNQVGADTHDGNAAITGRMTWNPWYAEDGAYALHFGLAGSSRSPSRLDVAGRPTNIGARRLRLASRAELRVDSPNFVDTGFFEARHLNLAGAEFALGAGPLLLQAEYNWGFVDEATVGGVTADNALFQGFYAQGSWFLTGESRPYVRTQGVFGQARPEENFFCVKSEGSEHPAFHGRGAWQVAIRYSYLDLNSEPVRGGQLSDLTFGLNWWLNPNCRWMWNFVLADRDAANPASSGYAGGFASRFQVDF